MTTDEKILSAYFKCIGREVRACMPDEDGPSIIVSSDQGGNNLFFTELRLYEPEREASAGEPETTPELRAAFERAALRYLKDNAEPVGCKVIFERMSITRVGQDKALIQIYDLASAAADRRDDAGTTPEEPCDSPLHMRGVNAARRLLESSGHDVLDQDYSTEHGTAELVSIDRDTLVFSFVRTRTDAENGFPATSRVPDPEAARRIVERFTRENPVLADFPTRIDNVIVMVTRDDRAMVRIESNIY